MKVEILSLGSLDDDRENLVILTENEQLAEFCLHHIERRIVDGSHRHTSHGLHKPGMVNLYLVG